MNDNLTVDNFFKALVDSGAVQGEVNPSQFDKKVLRPMCFDQNLVLQTKV